jgi:CHAT domain-containing protein/Tfp pilus assembly protein PilF
VRTFLVGLALVVASWVAPSLTAAPPWSGVVQPSVDATRGLVVEHVGARARDAGLRPGDTLVAWRLDAGGVADDQALDDLLDLERLEADHGVSGARVRISGLRDERPFDALIAGPPWELQVRPPLSTSDLPEYESARARLDAGDGRQAAQLWDALATRLAATGRHRWAAWVRLGGADSLRLRFADEAEPLYRTVMDWAAEAQEPRAEVATLRRLADLMATRGRCDQADAALNTAIEIEERLTPDSLHVAAVLSAQAGVARRCGQLARAATFNDRSLAIRRGLGEGGLAELSALLEAGHIARARADLPGAGQYYEQALAIAEAFDAEGALAAAALQNRGHVYAFSGEPARAEAHYRRALAIRARLAPDSAAHGEILGDLAAAVERQGDFAASGDLFRRALGIVERAQPHSTPVASLLNNLGVSNLLRGDFESAERYLTASLALKEQLRTPPADQASTLGNLGLLAFERRDLASAEHYYRRALEVRRAIAPASLEVAALQTNLAKVLRERRALDEAEVLARDGLAIRQQQAPDTLLHAFTLVELGNIRQAQGAIAEALRLQQEALAIRERRSPDSTSVAQSLDALATLAVQQGEVARARSLRQRSLGIWSRLAPGSLNEAQTLNALGRIARDDQRADEALAYFTRALEALESQVTRLGGSQEVKAGYRAAVGTFYGDAIELLLARGREAEAFEMLERSRARTLLAMLAERELVFDADLPAEIERARRVAARQYDAAQARLASRHPLEQADEIERLLAELRRLRDEQAAIATRIRDQSPRFAALQYPQPLASTDASAALEAGTLLLSYHVTGTHAVVFSLSTGRPLQVWRLPIDEPTLRDRVERFRRLIDRGASGEESLDGLVAEGRSLYQALLAPVEPLIAAHDRLLIVPDGPLHVLPFAALVREGSIGAAANTRGWHYLVQWKPTHQTASATVYAQTRTSAREPRTHADGGLLVAFGDPDYRLAPPASRSPAGAHSTIQGNLSRLGPLPGTRVEVNGIAAVHTRHEVYVGEAATETRARARMPEARYVHFAVHGELNELFPLDSGLALTRAGDDDNGVLQAWEIFEGIRLDADLVVLSACESGLGTEYSGEGLLGLTRAFQYAGARSVIASLWTVADETTPDLLRRLYEHLGAGRPSGEALSMAQRHAIDQAATSSHPYFWAGFMLNGLWN